MQARIAEARQYIAAGKWPEALQALDYLTQDKSVLYCGSLLCRFLDDYEREIRIIERALSQNHNWAYMKSRKRWHETPLSNHWRAQSKLAISVRLSARRLEFLGVFAVKQKSPFRRGSPSPPRSRSASSRATYPVVDHYRKHVD